MKALIFDSFGGALSIREVPSPEPRAGGVVLRVGATGICRSDWHGWQGHDPDITLPHVPGHEVAGTVEAVGIGVRRWQVGDRVTVPFICACGRCAQCAVGDHQVCPNQTQPGFTHWGSFAEFVAVDAADTNVVALPASMSFGTAASLGCRFATSYRAVVQQGRVRAGEWVAVHGCGGVGLSAIHIAVQAGARVVAVDPSGGARDLARQFGAELTLDGSGDVAVQIRELTGGGAHLSLDAFGSSDTCVGSIRCLRARGRHVQVGLLPPAQGRPLVPMERVLSLELELIGSHGMAAHAYPELLGLVTTGRLRPQDLVTRTVDLDQAAAALINVGRTPGITVVTSF